MPPTFSLPPQTTNTCGAAAPPTSCNILAPTWRLLMLLTTFMHAPADNRLHCTGLVTSLHRPDIFHVSQPGPTSMLQPGEFIVLGDFRSQAHTDMCETMQHSHEMP